MAPFAWRLAACAAAGVFAAYFAASSAAGADTERIALSATKFEFSAKEIYVRKGRPVTLVLQATDFAHGFSVPDFHVRKDLIPGQTVEVTFTPDKAGRFDFLCDNFCGEGHDFMMGTLVVTE